MLRMSEVNEVDHQSMQHMLTEGTVDWDGFGKQIAQETNALLGSPESVLLFDESGFGKKGKSSAGVARQWNGRLGKVDNCQVGVFATLCRGEMVSLIDTLSVFAGRLGERFETLRENRHSKETTTVSKQKCFGISHASDCITTRHPFWLCWH